MPHERFHYRTLAELKACARALGAWLPLAEELSALAQPLPLAGRTLHNRIALQPMEGSDAKPDGSPSALTRRRYLRFAQGGAALIWFEAVATAPEARASAHQLMLTGDNLASFARLVAEIKEAGLAKNGYEPLVVMQATHSGRYSKPQGKPEPLIAYNNPILEGNAPLPAGRILDDGALERYEARFGTAARLAQRAGFDGMDVKCCHGYLAAELLSAYQRPGRYGGSLENRTRFLLNAHRAARAEVRAPFFLTTRLNAYDGFPYPYGFGVSPGGGVEPDLREALALVGRLAREFSLPLINITIGNPYKNPHVNRPYDQGGYLPDEHPLTGVARMMSCVSQVQRAHPRLPVVGSAFSYLRGFSAHLAAGMVQGGHAALAGFGRMALANPEFPRQILIGGAIDPQQVCLTCGMCAQLLRAGRPSGCAVRDRAAYCLSEEE